MVLYHSLLLYEKIHTIKRTLLTCTIRGLKDLREGCVEKWVKSLEMCGRTKKFVKSK